MLYFGLILIFAGMYYVVSNVHPQCINSAGEMIGTGEGARVFGDCFQLSWTTFSTVGYGIIFPATGASGFYVSTGCLGVGLLGSLEAFMGVLYAGFCGAILFGKVLRSQNNAQVFFSDPIVVRFGKKELSDGSNNNTPMGPTMEEVKEEAQDARDEEMGGGSTSLVAEEDDEIPCPSLEFRLVNRLHGVPSGEIGESELFMSAHAIVYHFDTNSFKSINNQSRPS